MECKHNIIPAEIFDICTDYGSQPRIQNNFCSHYLISKSCYGDKIISLCYNYVIINNRVMKRNISYELCYNQSIEYNNGFAVVQTSNGEFAYMEENTNKLLPYRYDVASQFNNHGFAIVGKANSVTFINRNFQYLSKNGTFVSENLDKEYITFEGFSSLKSGFDKDIPSYLNLFSRHMFDSNGYLITPVDETVLEWLIENDKTKSEEDQKRSKYCISFKDINNKTLYMDSCGVIIESTGHLTKTNNNIKIKSQY